MEDGEGEEDHLHTVYLQLYPELIAYPCLFLIHATGRVKAVLVSEKYMVRYPSIRWRKFIYF